MENSSVLVVDDDAAMRAMLLERLRETTIEAVAVDSVDAAFDALRTREFGAVLSDVQLSAC